MTGIEIGNLYMEKPVIQGGMGIGVSRSRLAGAVAANGGMGVISTAQIGYDAPDFQRDPEGVNLRTLPMEIEKAKEISGNRGIVAVNLMAVTQLYGDYVRTAAATGADAIISGAGLPVALPEYTAGTDIKIAPIVSSKKAAQLILKIWDKKYRRTADFLVMEGPQAGGHLGFSKEELTDLNEAYQTFEENVRMTVDLKTQYEEKYGRKIPLFVAGGIFSKEDSRHVMELGADGIQAATRFIATEECDASDAYKQAFIQAKEEDVMIIDSPVGMPGRALRNPFVEKMLKDREQICFCYNCLKACRPNTAKYCISQALINAVKGDLEHGLIFCGSRVGEIREMQTAADVIEELLP